MNDLEKLQNSLILYEKLLKSRDNKEIDFSNPPTWRNGESDLFFREMVKIYGFNGKPVVVGNKQFDNIPSQTFYHGFARYSYGNSFLNDKNYWTGTGSSTNGFYATNNFSEAVSYTPQNLNEDKDENKVLNFKCDSINFLHVHQLWLVQECILNETLEGLPEIFVPKVKLLFDFVDSIDDNDLKQGFIDMMLYESQLATYLGFDFIIETDNTSIFLNRGKMIVGKDSIKTFDAGTAMENSQPLK